jgi:Ca-activated chloride channel family protein
MIQIAGISWGLAGLVLAIAGLVALLAPWRNKTAVIRFSNLGLVHDAVKGRRLWAEPVLKGLRTLVILGLVLALFRPRSGHTVEEVLSPGVDIVLVLDLSGSMRAEDMGSHSRIDAAKEVLGQFVKGRQHDRIGLVVFASHAFTQCPLTLDYPLLERLISRLQIGVIKEDSTAIGMGLATGLNRLKDSTAKSKLIILATDGNNNAGSIEPATAADMAKALGVRVYTVGVASKGPARIPVRDAFGRTTYAQINEDLNEESLTAIARSTGGIFRRATDDEALKEVFNEISNLEKTPVKTTEYQLYNELFLYLIVPALVLLMLEYLLVHTLFRKVP